VTSEAAAHGVTSAAKATAAMSAPAASMSAPATKRHRAGGGHCHAEGDRMRSKTVQLVTQE
jgi:hypothetical protein